MDLNQVISYPGFWQGFYFVITGIWPIIHIRSFLKVTGPKTDLWLVKTVGLLITVIGVTLFYAPVPTAFLLGITSALALGNIDVIYVAKGTISKVYLLDAVAQLALLMWWLVYFTYISVSRVTP